MDAHTAWLELARQLDGRVYHLKPYRGRIAVGMTADSKLGVQAAWWWVSVLPGIRTVRGLARPPSCRAWLSVSPTDLVRVARGELPSEKIPWAGTFEALQDLLQGIEMRALLSGCTT